MFLALTAQRIRIMPPSRYPLLSSSSSYNLMSVIRTSTTVATYTSTVTKCMRFNVAYEPASSRTGNNVTFFGNRKRRSPSRERATRTRKSASGSWWPMHRISAERYNGPCGSLSVLEFQLVAEAAECNYVAALEKAFHETLTSIFVTGRARENSSIAKNLWLVISEF